MQSRNGMRWPFTMPQDILGIRFALNVAIATAIVWYSLAHIADTNPIWAIASMVAASDPQVNEAARMFRSRLINVLVGATIVGSVATVWHGVVNPPRTRGMREWRYDKEQIVLAKGAEMGRFLLGSTVVMLFPKNVLTFVPDWAPSRPVRLGEPMAAALR